MHSLLDGPNSYRVEVSGWNVKGTFFVETAVLHWTDLGEKSVELMSRLHEGLRSVCAADPCHDGKHQLSCCIPRPKHRV